MKLAVNIPRAILIALVIFYAFIIFSHFTKNLKEGLENKEDEGKEEEDDLEELEEGLENKEDEEEQEETMLEKMSRIEQEISDLESEVDERNKEIEKRNKELDKLKEEIDINVEAPVSE